MMACDPQLSIPLDPFHVLSGVSLVPSKIRAPPDAPFPSDLNDLDSLHSFMKSMESSSPERAMDEGKIICDRGPELLSSKFEEFMDALGVDKDTVTLEGKEKPLVRREGLLRREGLDRKRPLFTEGVDKDTVTLEGKEKPLVRREGLLRREGLDRKRPRFSIKPVKRQASVDLEQSPNFDQLQDPAEFFSAVERHENARREIQILKGETASHSTTYDPSMNRLRRPGILGKSVNYKQRYSSAILERDDMHMSSPELAGSLGELREGINTPNNPEKEEIDMEGSIVETENKVKEILDELLSKDEEDLDGDGAESLLQELLQFKPIDIGNLSVPEFHDVGRTNFRILTEKLPRTRKTMPNIGNLVKGLTGGTPKKLIQGTESPSDFVASPTPPRSPLASISMLETRTLQSNTQGDPSSPHDVDSSGQRNSHSGVVVEEELHQVSVLDESSMPGCPSIYMEVDACRLQVSDIDSQRVRHAGTSDSALDKNIDAQAMRTDASSPHESQNDMLEQQTDVNLDGKTTECNLSDSYADGIEGNKLTDNVGDELKVSLVEALPNDEDIKETASSPDMHQCSQVEEMQAANIQEPSNLNTLDNSQNLTNEVIEVAAEGNHMGVPSAIGEVNAEQNSQKCTLQKQHCKTKRSRGTQRESKAYTLSPSLAAAGTSFESGVRRSKRIKTRRLEYWKGERLLYGRVNDRVKLVGLKYISPAKGGGKLKVKSYVPDEYNKILELAAAH